jgi:hypothetical protein
MEWIAAAVALLLIFLAVIVITSYWFDESHQVYDTGNGIKVKCPEGDGLSRVYGGEIFCPYCSVKLKPPKRKYRWERR